MEYPSLNDADNERSENITLKSGEGTLRGHVYYPKVEKPGAKIVLCFSGSGGPAAEYVGNFANEYLKNGCKVVSFDYRGFGKSETNWIHKDGTRTKKGTFLSERSLYNDARAMVGYLIKGGVKPCDIILHGYSLGAPIAAKVAADISEQAIIKAEIRGRVSREKDRIGGLVLHSPMSSMREAVQLQLKGDGMWSWLSWCIGKIAKHSSGAFNTRDQLERCYENDPNLPVHFVGNQFNKNDIKEKNAYDWLSPKRTKIDQVKKAPFSNQSTSISKGLDHEAPLDFGVEGDPAIRELCEKGRAADLKKIERNNNRQAIDNGLIGL